MESSSARKWDALPDQLDVLAGASAPAHDPLVDLVQPAPASPAPTPLTPELGKMFLSYYGLRENPFADSLNPGFFYRTEAHGDALERIMLTVENDLSLGMVTGESGTGKTLLTQLILQQLDPAKYCPVLVLVSPGLSKTGLLREILSELNVALPVGVARTQELIKLLSNCVIELHQQGRKLVILIDECHFLSGDNLHIIRTISNIEIPERKLVTCLLIGEARFPQRLQHPSFDSIRNRMYLQCVLPPMSAEDCAEYVKFRLMSSGGNDNLFDAEALAAVHTRAGGVGRSVNKLCMLALLEGCLARAAGISAELVHRAAARG